ncbi:hypothetical protein MLD38_030759 [Melastoma candidum]|nr:hypothetical protein MLD38_030759 [Melastoma candidum]
MIEEGSRSPLIPIPPAPPPPPPFRVPDWKFVVVDRHYVRIKSREPSGTDTPDVTDNEDDRSPMVSEGSQSPMTSMATSTVTTKGEEEKGMIFCPSPDVDTKADKFIARFREGLKLEKMNSWNQRQGTVTVRSTLGPSRDQRSAN